MRTLLIPLLLLSASAVAPANASGVEVTMDEVRTIAFAQPVATVYVGNPAIADVNMIDARHAFLLGKSFGTTNILALNKEGKPISNEQVTVTGRNSEMVTVHKGTQQITYNCAASRCEPTAEPGDAKDAFDSAIDQVTRHADLGKKSAIAQQ